ncbi:MAG TPA: hypothetical protein PLO59_05885, partial [Bacteroidia bacterium]|nr:hypothetical protein [Bacteroidia bacterium]
VLGVGSYTYQMNTRDTMGFAAKGAWFEVSQSAWSHPDEGELTIKTGYNIYKDPVTDDGSKKSLKGFQFVQFNNGEFEVISEATEEVAYSDANILQTIYKDGKFYNETTLTEIRERMDKLV